MPKHSIIVKEYRGLSRHAMYSKAAKLHSDNGRCWWIARKIQETLALDEAEKRRVCQTRKQRVGNKKKEKRTKP